MAVTISTSEKVYMNHRSCMEIGNEVNQCVPPRMTNDNLVYEGSSMCSNKFQQMEEDVAEARDMLESILKQRKETPVHLEQANVQPKVGTCTYYVSFPGFYVSTTYGWGEGHKL